MITSVMDVRALEICCFSTFYYVQLLHRCILGCIQKFPDWLPGVITVNGTALCHEVQL